MAEPSISNQPAGGDRRARILEAALLAARGFLNEDSWRDGLTDVLEALCQAADADRAFLYRYRDEGPGTEGSVRRLGEWQRDGLGRITVPAHVPFAADAEPQMRETLRAGRMVTLAIHELPEAIVARLPASHGWIVMVPVLSAGELWGVIGFADFSRDVPWDRSETETLALTGNVLGAAVHREQVVRRLRASERRFKVLVENVPAVVYSCNNDAEYSMLYLSADVEDLTGHPAEEFLAGRISFVDLYHGDDGPNIQPLVDRALAAREPFSLEYRLRHANGSWRWIEERGQGVFDPETDELEFLEGSLIDITERKEIERQLLHSAFRDALTELPNRALFLDRLAMALERSQRSEGYRFAVLFIDLDDFKLVNDGLGHMVGDRMLVTVGRRLRGCVRPGDTVARFGGDEFAILADGIAGPTEAEALAARVVNELCAPFTIDGHEIFGSASLGIALSEEGYETPEEMLRDADTAMYRAKDRGRGRFAFFEPSMHSSALTRLQIESELQRALERDELVLLYQPIVGLGTGRVCAAEALLRWSRPSRGLVRPSEFLDAAARTNLLPELGRWVLEAACQALAGWNVDYPDLIIGINLHPEEFSRPGLVLEISDALQRSGVRPQALCLELTEQVMLADPVRGGAAFEELRELGVRLSLDDFGQGYSSLAYLHRYPITSLKLDRSFLRDNGVRDSLRLLRSVALLAGGLDVRTVAEGIETPEHLELVKQAGLDMGQGHFFARPGSEVALGRMLAEDPRW